MAEIQSLEDLRSAPRVAPPSLLWVMFAIAMAGFGVLAFAPAGEPADRVATSDSRAASTMAHERIKGESAKASASSH